MRPRGFSFFFVRKELSVDCRIAKCLTVLRNEFAASSVRGELRLVKVALPLQPLELSNHELDYPLLGQIQGSATDGRESYDIEPWHDDQEQIRTTLAVDHAGSNAGILDRYVELSAAAVRCLGGPVQAPKDFELAHLPATNEQDLMRGWTARPLDWAIGQQNPLLHASRSLIDSTIFADGDEVFLIGAGAMPVHASEAQRITKLKEIISGQGYVLELQACLLRASVFGIERLLQEAYT